MFLYSDSHTSNLDVHLPASVPDGLSEKHVVYKVPGQLQWLVKDALRENCFCWVFYSTIQHRLKCRTHHPNSPGIQTQND